jgi:hypothetical protein
LRKEKGIGDSPSPTTLSAYPETHPLHLWAFLRALSIHTSTPKLSLCDSNIGVLEGENGKLTGDLVKIQILYCPKSAS